MASIVRVERTVEVDSISPQKQPEISPPRNTDTDSVSVEVENPVSDCEQQPTEPPPILIRRGSFLTCCMACKLVLKLLYYLTCCLLIICFASVAYAFVTVVTVAIATLLLGTCVVVRLFGFIVGGKNYEKRFAFLLLLRYWILVVMMLLLVEVGLFYPIAKNVPGLELVRIIGLPITKWITIISILIGINLISQLTWIFLCLIIAKVITDDFSKHFILSQSTSEIIGCLLFLWAEVVVMGSFSTFERSKIFGIYTRQWIRVSLFMLIGYNVILSLTHILVWSLSIIFEDYLEVGENINSAFSAVCCDCLRLDIFNKKNIVYVANGIKRSIIFMLSMVMLLVTWVVYFGNRLELDTLPVNNRILEIGIWTFISLLICSFLWLFKSCVLLYWEAHTVYDRLHFKIRDIGKRLYFLIMLSYKHYQIIVEPCMNESNDPDSGLLSPPIKMEWWILPDTSSMRDTYKRFNRKNVRRDFINYTGQNASIYDLQKAAERFLTAQNALWNETTVGDLRHLQGNESGESNAKCIKILKKTVQVEGNPYFDEDWEMLLELLPDVHTTEDITPQKVQTFMERAHSSGMFLINTLISENEVVKCLNQVISGIIIAVTCIMWLLLTGLATTKVLVLIASPLLAATFIFGDTAKNLFQGLIFVYVVHPFDVGDLCRIDQELLEVKRIGIWSTIFSNIRAIGEQEQIIYPNSVLSLKNVINHKTNFNWSDHIEILCSPDKKITEPLKHKLEIYLREENEKFTPNFHSVEILEMGDKAKIAIHIRHNFPTTEGWTYFECLKEKEKRKFELAIYVQNLVKQLEFGTEASETVIAESAEIEDFYTRG